ncbi:hypothetical protein Agub_g2623, partial [Astrephomene gubernaculifera]
MQLASSGAPLSSQQPSSIVKAGQLWKQDNFYVWRKHFFVVFSGEEPLIGLYYQYKGDAPPDKTKPLPGCRVLDIVEQQGRYKFTLEFKDKQRWYLASNSPEDRKEWLAAVVAHYHGGGTLGRPAAEYDPLTGAVLGRQHHRQRPGHSVAGSTPAARSSASSPPGSPTRSASPSHSVRFSAEDADGERASRCGSVTASDASTPKRSHASGPGPPGASASAGSLPALQHHQHQQHQVVGQHASSTRDAGGHSRRQSGDGVVGASALPTAASRLNGHTGGGGGGGAARNRAATLPAAGFVGGPLAAAAVAALESASSVAAGVAASMARPAAAPAPAPSGQRSSILKFLLGDHSALLPLREVAQAAPQQQQQPRPPSPPRRYEVAPLGPPVGQLDVLSGKFDGSLVTSSLCEQFDRARTYVEKYPEHFSGQQRAALQNWTALVESRAATADVLLACKALYVLEVTRTRADWSAADEGDATFAGPEAMIVQVRRLPSAASLGSLKECLDYCSRDWVDMFCRLDGAALLLDVLKSHEGPAREGVPEAIEALLASLQCIQSLASKPGGMAAVLAVRGFTRAVAALLQPVDSDTTRLALELLTRMLLFHDESYRQ